MKDLKFAETRIVKLSRRIKHQKIGGKKFRIEKVGKMAYILDMNCRDYTWAVKNFVARRDDILTVPDDMTIYYGHVLKTGLGYFIAEDEIDKEIG